MFRAVAALCCAGLVLVGGMSPADAADEDFGTGEPAFSYATPEDRAAVVGWYPPVDDAITGYTVEAMPGGRSVNVGKRVTEVKIGGLTNGVEYTFTVTPRTKNGHLEPLPAFQPTATPRPVMKVSTKKTVREGDGTEQLTLNVRLSSPTRTPVTFYLATRDGTALAGSDYVGVPMLSRQVMIPAFVKEFDVDVEILGDTIAEGREEFRVGYVAPSGAAFADNGPVAETIVTIRDND